MYYAAVLIHFNVLLCVHAGTPLFVVLTTAFTMYNYLPHAHREVTKG